MKKLLAIFITAFLGCGLFVMLTLAVIAHLFDLGAAILISLPTVCVMKLLRLDDSFLNSETFVIVVNALLGALVFGIMAAFWQFIVKGSNESKN